MDSSEKSSDLLLRLGKEPLTFTGEKGKYVMASLSTPPSKQQADVQVIESVGSGGQGYVYKAWDSKLAKKICVKTVRKTAKVSFEEAKAGIQREIGCLKKLSEAGIRANIVSMHDYGESSLGPFIFLERCRGSNLWKLWSHYKDKQSEIPSTALHKIMWDAASAVKHCSEIGILHCDLSPGNFVWCPSMYRSVKLIDLGYAVVIDEADRFLGGTSGFLPPEQLLKKKPHLRSDVFGLGCMFFALRTMESLGWNIIAGRQYFNGEDLSRKLTILRNQHYRELKKLNPMEERRLLCSMLDFDASKRPTWDSVLKQIESITTGAVLSEDAVIATQDSGSCSDTVQSGDVTTANLDQPADNSSSSGLTFQSADDAKFQKPASAKRYDDYLDSPEEQKFEEENYPVTKASRERHREEQKQKTAYHLKDLEKVDGFKIVLSQKATELKSDIAKMKRSKRAHPETKEEATKKIRKSILELGEKAKKEMREHLQQEVEHKMSEFASEVHDIIVSSEFEAVE